MTRTTSLAACAAMAAFAGCTESAAADVPMPLAVEAAQAAIASCRANGYHVTVTIMDADFSTRVVLRDDGAPGLTVEVGRRKAYTVIKTGMSSGEFGKTLPPAGEKDEACVKAGIDKVADQLK